MVGANSQVRSFDLMRQLVQTVTNFFSGSKRPAYCPPSDGPVLKMHYKYTFWIAMFTFAAVWYSWLHRDIIVCVSHFNAELQVRMDYLNICLSFPYIVGENGLKHYLLFYRWVHWVCFLIAIAFYAPRKFSKAAETSKLTKLYEYMSSGMTNYEDFDQRSVTAAARYLIFHCGTNDSLYYRYLHSHILSLVINIGCFMSIDALLQNKFAGLGYEAYPYTRNGEHLTDVISQAFPPFAECAIRPEQMLMNKRTEVYGCHLTAMEFYEKMFLATWFWMIALMIITTIYIIYLLGFMSPLGRKYIMRLPKPVKFKESLTETRLEAGQDFTVGDWYLLHRMRNMFSISGYCELLTKLCEQDYKKNVADAIRKEKPLGLLGYGNPNKGILVE